jgi:hypothetical protein
VKRNKSTTKKARLLISKRKCEKCGAVLSDEDVMKIKFENGSWETIPLPMCPRCFKERMRLLAYNREKTSNRSP